MVKFNFKDMVEIEKPKDGQENITTIKEADVKTCNNGTIN